MHHVPIGVTITLTPYDTLHLYNALRERLPFYVGEVEERLEYWNAHYKHAHYQQRYDLTNAQDRLATCRSLYESFKDRRSSGEVFNPELTISIKELRLLIVIAHELLIKEKGSAKLNEETAVFFHYPAQSFVSVFKDLFLKLCASEGEYYAAIDKRPPFAVCQSVSPNIPCNSEKECYTSPFTNKTE